MGLFSAILGNAGAVTQEELMSQYGQLLTEGEEIELGFKLIRASYTGKNSRPLDNLYRDRAYMQ